MESVRKWTSSSPEDFCLSSLLKVCKSVGKWNRISTQDFCMYSSLNVYRISKEMDQELHRRLLLIFFLKSKWNQQGNGPGAPQRTSAYIIQSVWNQWGNGPGAPQMTSAYIPHQTWMESVRKRTSSSPEDFCLYSLSKVCGTIKEMDQELQRGLIFRPSTRLVRRGGRPHFF